MVAMTFAAPMTSAARTAGAVRSRTCARIGRVAPLPAVRGLAASSVSFGKSFATGTELSKASAQINIKSAEPRARSGNICQASGVAIPGQKSGYEKLCETLTTLFPVWVFIGAAVGIAKPAMVTWFSSGLFTLGLGFLMLSMGLTLTFDDFRQCMKNPGTIGIGFLAQYLIKPVLGYLIAAFLGLPPPLATGLILVSCCPGGQASNVATYIAHGNVALSVLMTTCSTIGAIFMTPLLTKLLAGQLVPVDAGGLAMSTFQVVLMPTVVGVLANEYAHGIVKKLTPILPLIGVVMTTLLCASPIGQVSQILLREGAQLVLPVALLHIVAFSLGYFLSKAVGFSEKTARTVSIETGMQSAALGFLLAQQHFADPLVAVPSAVSVVFMALGGSGLAVYWRGKPTVEKVSDIIN